MSCDPMAHIFFGFYLDPDLIPPWYGYDLEEWLDEHARPLGLETGIHGNIHGPYIEFVYVKESMSNAWVRPNPVRIDRLHQDIIGWTELLTSFAESAGLKVYSNPGEDENKPYKVDWWFAAHST